MSIRSHITAWLLAGTAAVTASPARAVQHAANPYSCRSAHTHSAYWFRGVESDACDGPLPDGTFGGEAATGFDANERINHRSAPVRACTVQLNRIVHGKAIPVPGANSTESGRIGGSEYFDGRFCDAMSAWRPPSGFYNVTVTYRTAAGRVVQTVQGPVAFYPGGAGG